MPGILERWQAVMTRNPDPTNALFLKAAERAGKAQAALKDVYRKLRDDDPDSIKDVDAQDVKRMVILLGREMDSKDAAVRERAAKLLGLLGSGDAAYTLVKTLRVEPEVQTAGAVAAALVAIGGRRTAEQLSGLRNDDKGATRAYEVVEKLAASNPVDRRIALLEMGKFVLAKDAGISKRALDALVGAGAEGAPGLLEALGTNDTDARITIIGALGRAGNHRVAGRLAGFLIGGDVPNTIRTREAATAAIKALGDPGVPYLMEGLRGSTTKMYTGLILREMTGQMFSASRPGDWAAWWKRTHPDWKPGD
jgi:HEAT repeat protein